MEHREQRDIGRRHEVRIVCWARCKPEGTEVGRIICILELKYINYYLLISDCPKYTEESGWRPTNAEKHLLYGQTSASSTSDQTGREWQTLADQS
jgi:hypothetical protein